LALIETSQVAAISMTFFGMLMNSPGQLFWPMESLLRLFFFGRFRGGIPGYNRGRGRLQEMNALTA
jgi:hypothetical protein